MVASLKGTNGFRSRDRGGRQGSISGGFLRRVRTSTYSSLPFGSFTLEVLMKLVKSLLLGSAAVLTVAAGAQAADLPSRKAAPVEYVKICDAYGAGFFYIPGTDTCLRLGGYVRAEYDYTPGHKHHQRGRTGAQSTQVGRGPGSDRHGNARPHRCRCAHADELGHGADRHQSARHQYRRYPHHARHRPISRPPMRRAATARRP